MKEKSLHVFAILLTVRILNDTGNYLSNQKYDKKILLTDLGMYKLPPSGLPCQPCNLGWENRVKLQGKLRPSDVITSWKINGNTLSVMGWVSSKPFRIKRGSDPDLE